MKFGTDGIRGKVEDIFTQNNIEKLGISIAQLILKNKLEKNILVTMDTRESGPMIEKHLNTGLSKMGISTHSMGILPTPAVSHIIQEETKFSYGIVISASHNPYYDNGIKIFNNKGFKISQTEKEQIEYFYKSLANSNSKNTHEDLQSFKTGVFTDISEKSFKQYQDIINKKFKITLNGINIVLDTANGAFSKIAEPIFKAFGASIKVINNTPNGKNINLKCGATHLDSLVDYMKKNNADIGISFDGDGDRVMIVDSNGKVLDGDYMLAILTKYMKSTQQLNKNTVVITPMTNFGFMQAMKALDIETLEVPVGDQNITNAIFKKQANNSSDYEYSIGGEQSGHVIIAKDAKSGDGLLTALEVLRVLIKNNTTIEEEAKILTKYPQILIGIPVKEKIPLKDIPNFTKAYKKIEDELKGNGRINVRYSGTEPLLRIMLEGKDPSRLKTMSEDLKQIVINH